ncbi:MAG: DUF4388 domain-containing protein [Myxococcales bacterium]|nr:DUF4388 domain-containing protein [Myxococcota bacterium]MDW8281819.1 DUF4388 domain-containing protein [Myxococcales bacterium]
MSTRNRFLDEVEEVEEVEAVEEVEVDEDVSAADLTGESMLPADEQPEPDSESTSPRRSWPVRPPMFEEPLWEQTSPQLEAEPLGIRQQARRLAQEAEDPTGKTELPEAPLLPLLPEEAVQEAVLAGDLAAIPLIDVLNMLARQQQTGVLKVMSGQRRIEITLQQGQVALATASGCEDLRLGRFVVEMEAAEASEIEELACAPTALHTEAPLLGLRLCQVGYLTRDDLREALSRQSREIIYEALRLRSGRFLFSKPEELPRMAVDRTWGGDLQLDLESVLLEGYRRIHEWYLVERELTEGAVYMRSDDRAALDRVGLTREEQQVLQLCTGRNAISDIARDTRLGPMDVMRILQRLEAVQLVRRRVPPQAV